MLRAVADFPMKLYVPYADLPYPGAHCRSDASGRRFSHFHLITDCHWIRWIYFPHVAN